MSDAPTPRTDDAQFGTGRVSVNFARQLERELNEARENLDFLKSKGLTVGMMTSSDKPEPYPVYVIEYDSELCDMRAVNKLVDAEIERDSLRAINAELEECLRMALAEWKAQYSVYGSATFSAGNQALTKSKQSRNG